MSFSRLLVLAHQSISQNLNRGDSLGPTGKQSGYEQVKLHKIISFIIFLNLWIPPLILSREVLASLLC